MAAIETSMTTTSATTGSGTTTTSGGGTDETPTSPSELFHEYNACKDEGYGGAESLLQSALSSLAAQQDLFEVWKSETGDEEVSDWMWQSIRNPAPATDREGLPATDKFVPHTIEYEWWMGTQLIARILPELSSFEIHAVATQSSVFTEGSQSHWMLCLILCVYALRQCPSPLEQRWKRWQSLTCETIRLFQNYGMEMEFHAVPVWIQHIVPACQHVKRQLPPEALHMALLSGLVGTTSMLVTKECESSKQVQTASLSRAVQLLKTVRNIVAIGGEAEEWIWSNPWRSTCEPFVGEQSQEVDEDVVFENSKYDITWWNRIAHCHEKVAGMDTSWDETGISLLALMAFDDRPLTFTPTFTWDTWFPHVAILFKAANEYAFLEGLPFLLLEKLFRVVPEKSLPTVSSASKKVEAPYETFQLLSNRIMLKSQKKGAKKKSKKELELETKTRSERIAALMKSLLSRYPAVNQIKIVRKLVHDCPHPGLQAKFMDLLRPVIFEEECAEALWSYIGSFVKDLLSHVDEGKNELFNSSDLIEKVEIYVGAITMIQLWCMVKGRLPKKIKGTPLGKFYKILKKSIATWMTDEHAMPPDDYYRLYLLEGALEQLMRILKEAKEKRKQGGNEDGSLNDSYDTLGAPESSQSSNNDEETTTKEEEAVVGDADIFS